jgi:hypothetical protein
MTERRFRLACELALLIVAAVAAAPAYATGPDVKVSFKGANGLSGYFIYDSTLSGNGSFVFTGWGATYFHETCFAFNSKTCTAYSGVNCEPFVINTNLSGGMVFQLLATGPKSTALTINLATSVALPQDELPTCQTANFVASPAPGQSTFTMQPANESPKTYNITSVTCEMLRALVVVPVSYVIACPPPTCPVYVYEPRPACCLSGLFSRCSVRARCW